MNRWFQIALASGSIVIVLPGECKFQEQFLKGLHYVQKLRSLGMLFLVSPIVLNALMVQTAKESGRTKWQTGNVIFNLEVLKVNYCFGKIRTSNLIDDCFLTLSVHIYI